MPGMTAGRDQGQGAEQAAVLQARRQAAFSSIGRAGWHRVCGRRSGTQSYPPVRVYTESNQQHCVKSVPLGDIEISIKAFDTINYATLTVLGLDNTRSKRLASQQ